MVNINVEVDDDAHSKARLLSFKQKKTLIKFVNEAIAEKVKRES